MIPFLWHSRKGKTKELKGFPSGSDGKTSVCNAGDPGSIPGLGRSPGEGNGSPLQYSCLENSMDRGAWGAAVYRVAQSRTWLKRLSTHSWLLEDGSRSWLQKGTGKFWGVMELFYFLGVWLSDWVSKTSELYLRKENFTACINKLHLNKPCQNKK